MSGPAKMTDADQAAHFAQELEAERRRYGELNERLVAVVCSSVSGVEENVRLRTRLAESEAEVRRLTGGILDGLNRDLAKARESNARLTRSCDGWQGDARLYARNAADWEAKALAAEAERDDLLGALRGLEKVVCSIVFHLNDDMTVSVVNGEIVVIDGPLFQACESARAAIAKVGGGTP